MDPQFKKPTYKTNPWEKANIFSKICFFYTRDFLWKGFRENLENDSIYEVSPGYQSKKLCDRFEKEWSLQKKKSFTGLMWKFFGRTYILAGCALLVTTATNVIRPILIGKYIAYFTPNQTKYTRNDAFYLCFSLMFINYLETFFQHNYIVRTRLLAIKARATLCSFLYRNCLNLSQEQVDEISVGKFLTLINKDASSIPLVVCLFNHFWTGFVKVAVIFIVLYLEVGMTAFVFLGLFVMVVPLQSYFFYVATKLQLKVSQKSDKRFRMVKEVLGTIRTVKMYILEQFFDERIHKTRTSEVLLWYKVNYALILNAVLSALNQHLVFFLMVLTYGWLGNVLTPQKTYFMLTCFQSVMFEFNVAFPYGIFHVTTLAASMKRIENTVQIMQKASVLPKKLPSANPRISMRNFTLKIHEKTIFNEVCLDLGPGLTIVKGASGCGKSNLLKTILGENPSKKVVVEGRVSFAAQEPWIFPSTIRQNIIFAQDFDEKRYNEVVHVCGLAKDLEQFQNGDQTIIADRAINLSKGQQARINLARAIYKRSEIYLIDDCFGPLDLPVAQFIFEECLVSFLQGKIVLFVSNNKNFEARADTVLTVDCGSVETKQNSSRNIENCFKEGEKFVESFQDIEQFEEEIPNEKTALIGSKMECKPIYHEEKQIGSVKFENYRKYIQSGGGFALFVFVCFFYGINQIVVSYKGNFISQWVNFEVEFSQNNTGKASMRNNLHIEHGILVTAVAFTAFLQVFVNFIMTKKASLNLHKLMNRSILNAPMHFFDRVFLGNILNRYSKDFYVIDYSVPFVLSDILRIIFAFIGVVGVIASVNVGFLIPSSIFIVIMVCFRYFYIRTSRQSKRLVASSLCPVVGYMSTTLEGLTTIRANNAEEMLKTEFDQHQDRYTSISCIDECCSRFFIFYVDLLCMSFIFSVIVRFLISSDDVNVGGVGLAIYQAITLMMELQWGIFQWSELENQMTSVERVVEYTKVPGENRQGIQDENWPKQGRIVFNNVRLSYCNTWVLKNVNFHLNPGEKVAIVGRTGAGKSSIISSIFRLYDYEGSIVIDGTDIKTLSLDCLRSRIAIIPQDPALFTGTIRENLDPLQSYTDEEIWKCLDQVNLKNKITDLSTNVAEDGLKFSIGHRQLMCLAIVLLRRNKIVVFDEAVENVDADIEKLIRKVINEMAFCTLITVAHKLQFVMDFNRVLVLENGEIVENDTPENLMKMSDDGVFYRMVAKSRIDY